MVHAGSFAASDELVELLLGGGAKAVLRRVG